MTLERLSAALAEFAAERNWGAYHSPKNFAMALSVEAGELMEPLLWAGHEESRELVKNPEVKAALEGEVADVLISLVQFARSCDIDVEAAAWAKLEKLKVRYKPEEQRDGHFKVRDNGDVLARGMHHVNGDKA